MMDFDINFQSLNFKETHLHTYTHKKKPNTWTHAYIHTFTYNT